MNNITEQCESTRDRLIKHYQAYPKLQTEDILKYIFQSAFGCEHLVSSEDTALHYIKREYGSLPKMRVPVIDRLDGAYSRVSLSCLDDGLAPETFSKLFCLSAKKEPDGRNVLEQKIKAAKALIADGHLPIDSETFDRMLDEWRAKGYPPVHHSEAFRMAYHPAYRVISNRYADHLALFSEIDRLLGKGSATVAIKGASTNERTALAGILQEVYDCKLIHAKDFHGNPIAADATKKLTVVEGADIMYSESVQYFDYVVCLAH